MAAEEIGPVLSESRLRVLTKAAETILPDGEPWPSVAEVGVVSSIERHLKWMSNAQPAIVRDFSLLLDLVEWWPVFPGFRFSRFSRMNAEGATAELERWRRSGIFFRRLGYNALKSICAFYYYGDPKVFRHLPYDGTWKDKYNLPAIEIPGLEETPYHA